MKKSLLCVALLVLAVLMLTACGEKDGNGNIAPVDPGSFNPSASATQVNTVENTINHTEPQAEEYDWSSYDPASEEDGPDFWDGALDEYGRPTQIGATAIPLEPIDKPTPTPRAALAFQYERKEYEKLGLSFEIPKDWVEEAGGNSVRFSDIRTHDDYRAWIDVSVENLGTQVKKDDLKSRLSSRLSGLQGDLACSEWVTSDLTERKLMGGDGYYATFHGYSAGVEVRGRVHIGYSDGKLITIVYVCPATYVNDYYSVYDKLRSTLKKI